MCKNLFLLCSLIITVTAVAGEKFPTLEITGIYPTSCREVWNEGHTETGFYFIQPNNTTEPFLVLCEMRSSGGGWTTILNRYDGSQEFYLNWTDYKLGFGNLGGEFWLGLEKIHQITRYEINEVLFELVDWNETQADAHYDYFGVGSEEEGFILSLLEGYSGTAGDSFIHSAGTRFSTADKDQEQLSTDCAVAYRGGWWYPNFGNCGYENPTGKYHSNASNFDGTGLYWIPWHGFSYSLKEVRMMIRSIE